MSRTLLTSYHPWVLRLLAELGAPAHTSRLVLTIEAGFEPPQVELTYWPEVEAPGVPPGPVTQLFRLDPMPATEPTEGANHG